MRYAGGLMSCTRKEAGDNRTDIVFPVKGVYKIFSQVKHEGKVLLFDFMVTVQ
jgi:hypothetical protein